MMVNLSKVEIERQAQDLLRERFGPTPQVPINVEQIVRDLGGRIKVRFEGYRDPESLHIGADGSFTVFVPSNTSMLRDRFTIAHELGHYVLHRDRGVTKPVSFLRYGRSRLETEANAFAGALLMPVDSFQTAWQRHHRDLGAVAREFQVSQSAAGVRCQVLGLT